MKQTIIFLSGLAVPKILAKSKLVWDDTMWDNFDSVYYTSKIPISDKMVDLEIDNLCKLINDYDRPFVVGQSLGAWWGANLACLPECNINKLAMWTPVANASAYPIFNVTHCHNPRNKKVNDRFVGGKNSLLCYAENDLITPNYSQSLNFMIHFNPTIFKLNGGHLFQRNHEAGLIFMRDWFLDK